MLAMSCSSGEGLADWTEAAVRPTRFGIYRFDVDEFILLPNP